VLSDFFHTINKMALSSKRMIFGSLFLIIFMATAIKAAFFARFAFSPLKVDEKNTIRVQIRKGQGPHEISRILRSSGVLSSECDEARFFWLGRITREWNQVKAGEYEFSKSMSPFKIFSLLSSGISVARSVTVIEGENMYEIADHLEKQKLSSKQEFLKLCKSREFISSLGFDPSVIISLEGFLFPNTYNFNKTMSTQEIIRLMIKQYRTIWGAAEDSRARELGLTQYQAMTLASIIEKETGASQERPLIASVFFNRLKKKMRLQSDPTTIYGIWERYQGNLHKSDLLETTPYNTYAVAGLPLGPIANPGKEAIHAVLYPADSEYLYFVSHNNGTHQFSRTLEEHNLAVQKFQLDSKAREGKSWRDLEKQSK